ncbi:unnamed protein product [Gongylonema pulchrum]|uniref:Uncharacterized protein n=1 Tax=Gongylonema pulchrum TaxID=637853 RepID=A0A3P7PYB8_9BILA|nr:unnamed protein product [Gongylonema pulchrum]
MHEELTATISTTPKLLLSLNLLECDTTGGCLFDKSLCSYHNSHMSRGSTFQRTSIYGRNFVQALAPPGTIAVLETATSFAEDHKIVFDVLEFTEGERLFGCCFKKDLAPHDNIFDITSLLAGSRPPELFCPFATPAHSTSVIWRTARFTCPRGTSKVLFMCENFGTNNGTCAMDNIRVHKLFDVLEVEPCQKDIVAYS